MNNENNPECSHFSGDNRPKKRQRMMMHALPDGFSTSLTKSKQIQFIPQFSSAFEEPTTTPKKLKYKPHYLPPDARSTNSSHAPIRPVVNTTRPLNKVPLDEKRRVALTTLNHIQKTVDPPSGLTCLQTPIPLNSGMTSSLKPRVPPHPPVISKPLNTSFKQLPVPHFLAVPQAQTVKNMCTITTTEIALATDLFTEGGTAELASIFLHDHGAPHPLNVVQEEYRGLTSSQEFDPKKGVKFCRNGLAARASDLFDRSRTALFLWEKQSECQFARHNNGCDLKVRITRIIHAPSEHPPEGQRNPFMSLGIALCELLSSSHDSPSWSQKRLYKIAFSFKAALNIKKVALFVEGSTVCIWTPWQIIASSTSCTSLSPSTFATLPPSSPIALTTSDMVDLPVNISYICSRFVILP